MIQPIRGSDNIKVFDLTSSKSWNVKSLFKFPQEFAACQVDGIVYITGGCYKGAKSVSDVIKISNRG